MKGLTINSSNVKDISFITADLEGNNAITITNNNETKINLAIKSFGYNILINGQVIIQDNDSIDSTSIQLELYDNSTTNNLLETIIIPINSSQMGIININYSYKNHVGFGNILTPYINIKTGTTDNIADTNTQALLLGYTFSFTQVDKNNITNSSNASSSMCNSL